MEYFVHFFSESLVVQRHRVIDCFSNSILCQFILLSSSLLINYSLDIYIAFLLYSAILIDNIDHLEFKALLIPWCWSLNRWVNRITEIIIILSVNVRSFSIHKTIVNSRMIWSSTLFSILHHSRGDIFIKSISGERYLRFQLCLCSAILETCILLIKW